MSASTFSAATAARRRLYLDQIKVRPGATVLDIGCGPGGMTPLLRERIGASGRVIGVDPSGAALAIAQREHGLHGEFLCAACEAIPFQDASVDAVVSFEATEDMRDPRAMVREAHRVLRPGGALLLVHRDYDTLTVTVSDRALSRRVVAALCDAGPNGWAGRQLSGNLRAAPWSDRLTFAYTPVLTSYAEAQAQYPWVRAWLDAVVRAGHLGREEVERWYTEQRAADEAGEFLFSLIRFVCIATK